MRVLLDTCVLYPTVLREVLLGVAEAGLFTPLWSARILGEWRHVAARRGDAALAGGEIARLTGRFPEGSIAYRPEEEAALSLPDPADAHVLAAAIAGGAETLVTLNLRDFPLRALAPHGIAPSHPDPFLCACLGRDEAAVTRVVEAVRAKAARLSGQAQPLRALMKRARLPRFGKALSRG